MKYRPTITQPLRAKMDYNATALFLGVSMRTIKRWVKDEAIPHYRIGRRVYFDESRLFEWIGDCHVEVVDGV